MRVDLDDFFSSGSMEDLITHGCRIISDDRTRNMAEKAARFLLRMQLVRSDVIPGRRWRVRRGNGVGLRHNNALCDSALYDLMERIWL